jgi:hypothetical protein
MSLYTQQHRALNPTTKDDKILTPFVCHHRSDIFPTKLLQTFTGKKSHKVQARLSPVFPFFGVVIHKNGIKPMELVHFLRFNTSFILIRMAFNFIRWLIKMLCAHGYEKISSL